MTVYDLKDAEGRVYAFEIENTLLGRRRASKILAGIPGSCVIRMPKLLSWLRESVFCECEIEEARFVIEEPFGDNSRYWVGPEPARWVPQIDRVREAFRAA